MARVRYTIRREQDCQRCYATGLAYDGDGTGYYTCPDCEGAGKIVHEADLTPELLAEIVAGMRAEVSMS